MKRFIYSLTGALILVLISTSALWAQDYIINITVNGTPVALSVTFDDNDLTVTTKAQGVTVVSVITPTRAIVATPTPATAQNTATATSNANLRSGPGTSFAIAGSVTAGQKLTIVGKDDTGNWLKLSDGKWIAAFLVEQSAASGKSIPTVAPTATPTALPDVTASLEKSLLAALDAPNRDAERISSIYMDSGTIFIEWAINDSFWISDNTREEIVTILKTINASGIQYKLISLTGTFSMRDQYGNTSESSVVFVTYSVDTMSKINWSDNAFVNYSLPDNIYDLADLRNVHHEFQ